MNSILHWLAAFFLGLPMPLLEVWGRLAYIVGSALAIGAFGGFTFRPGGHWGVGRERQAWDSKAVLSIPLTFILIVGSGYLGSFIVLVPEAQTFESLKDLAVFLCIVLFGYPALIVVPFAYGLSDLIEGVPPNLLWHWLPGYFINPACFWIAYQLFGKNPDFRRARTWRRYLAFVVLFMTIEPILWGYICAAHFTSVISYGNITPALFLTTSITWILAPVAMLLAYPLTQKVGLFWAEIPRHVKERRLGRKEWVWEARGGRARPEVSALVEGWPIRVIILVPFIALVLVMVGVTAYVTLRSAEADANKLATRLHQEISDNIKLQLDEYLAHAPPDAINSADISDLLKGLAISQHGLALIIDASGRTIASSVAHDDPVAAEAVAGFKQMASSPSQLHPGIQFRFDYVVANPPSRETWLTRAAAYQDRRGEHVEWVVLTVMPESYYLAGLQTGNSRSAMIFALALLMSLTMAAVFAAIVTSRLRHISLATQALAQGDLSQRIPGSRMEELGTLAQSFNDMAEQLQKSFGALVREVEVRRQRELDLEASDARLRASENRLRQEMHFIDTLMDSLPGLVFLLEPQGKFLKWNTVLELVTGRSGEDFGRLTALDCVAAEDAAAYSIWIQTVLSEGQDATESQLLTKDGRTIPYYLKGVCLTTEHGRCILGIGYDISDRRRLEAQFRQAQKMEALGQLAAGVAHDFNNLLTVICGYSEVALSTLLDNDPHCESFKAIHRAGERATALTGQLLAFTRQAVLRPKVLDVNEVIKETETLLRRIIGEDVALTVNLAEDISRIKIDPGQLGQVLMNLSVNARDAMPQGGKLVIETREMGIDDEWKFSKHDKLGTYIQLTVSDSGSGMTPEVKARIFEPFFTTKGVGKGTGLGLAMVYGMIEQSGGQVEVESELGHGTSFMLYFPCVDEPASFHADDALAVPGRHGTETVLLVEDFDGVRDLALVALQTHGYRVLVAVNGNDALRVLDEHRNQLDMMVTDVVMTGMGGLELAELVRKRIPKLKVLYVSGYTDTALRHGVMQEDVDFLQKPYTPSSLTKRVREILDRPE